MPPIKSIAIAAIAAPLPLYLLAPGAFSHTEAPSHYGSEAAIEVQHGGGDASTAAENVPKDAQYSAAGSSWIVHFNTKVTDLRVLRHAIDARTDAPTYATLVQGLEHDAVARSIGFVSDAEDLGAEVHNVWWIINACEVAADAETIALLSSHELVERVEANTEIRTASSALPAPIKRATNSDNHDADRLQALGFTGRDTTIAILDTTFDSNMAGIGRPHRTFFGGGNPNNQTGAGIGGSRLLANIQIGAQPADSPTAGAPFYSDYHGTAVASIAAGGDWGLLDGSSDHGHAMGANIVGYSAVDSYPFGSIGFYQITSTSPATLVTGAQQILADRVLYGTTVANFSWSSLSDPANVFNEAMDQVASVGDILVVQIAGNTSQGVTNVTPPALNALQMGNVNADTHELATSTASGTILGDMRIPDLCANGNSIIAALANYENESTDAYMTGGIDGTSFAAPQAAGTAAILRSATPTISGLETKAILLASAETTPDTTTVLTEGAGCGYMRSTNAFLISRTPSKFGTALLSGAGNTFTRTVTIPAGQTCNFAVTWYRTDYSSTPTWSNLDLVVKQNGNVVASSLNSVDNTEEFIRFTPTSGGAFTFEVTAVSTDPGGVTCAWASTHN